MKLAHYIHGNENSANDTVVIVHGLFGQARNWNAIARKLANQYRVVTVDLRNHGQSGWDPDMTYQAMAGDLAELIGDLSKDPVHLVGHSMGGKASMMLALSDQADCVRDLVVVDIAPVSYDNDYTDYISAMRAVDFSKITRRSEVEEAIFPGVKDKGVCQFLAQNVVHNKESGLMEWQVNIDAIAQHIADITGWPENENLTPFKRDVLVISGAKSPYTNEQSREKTKLLFPKAAFTSIKDAGHWVHAEKPEAVLLTLSAFLSR